MRYYCKEKDKGVENSKREEREDKEEGYGRGDEVEDAGGKKACILKVES